MIGAARAAVLLLLFTCFAGCDREQRPLRELPPVVAPGSGVRMSDLQPGTSTPPRKIQNPYEGNAPALAEGQRLFTWYNCAGCHSPGGGGGMGPALIDNHWIYGREPENIYRSILDGRPNGMPSFEGRIPANQVWQLVAYIRSMAGLSELPPAPNRRAHVLQEQAQEHRKRSDKP
jgi:cytochrome c oxidase cbb3-type subunit III